MTATPASRKPSLSPLRTTLFFGATFATYLAASAAPTPLYHTYQERFATSPVVITIVFAVYAIALLAALLFAGSLSDHTGRKPVILGALALEMVAMVLFFLARGPDWLIAARTVQGAATGIATATLGAALVDVDGVTGSLVNAVAPFAGMTVGVFGSSTLVQFGPLPLQLVYALLFGIFALLALALVVTVPETAEARPGALASLRPHVAVPRHLRRPLALITPINAATWALGGFYLSLVPTLVVSVTGSRAPLTGGGVVGALMFAATSATLVRRRQAPEANLTFGVLFAVLGITVDVAGVNFASVPLLIVGALLTGIGFGSNFLGCVGSIVPLARADERAGLLAAFYIQSYLAFSIPSIVAGALAKSWGFAATSDIFGVAIVVAALGGLVALHLEQRNRIATAA